MNNFTKKTSKFFSRWLNRETFRAKRQNSLDKKLVLSLSDSRLPTPKQLGQLAKVLSVKERLVVRSLSLIIVLCLGTIGVLYYNSHVQYLPKAGGEYTEALIGAPNYINPILAQRNDVDRDISKLVFAGLFTYNQQGELAPDLAESYTISEDQKVYNITLAQNLKWDNGQPLTADDVIFTVASIQDAEFKSPLYNGFKGVGVEKVDDRTIKFVLSEPFAPFLGSLTFGILPEYIWRGIPPASANLAEYNLKPVGNGPFKFSSLTKDRSGNVKTYTLARNDNYHRQPAYLKKIIFNFYPDFEIGAEALAKKNVAGISFLPPPLKEKVAKNKNLVFYSLYLPQYTAVFFNQKNNEYLRDQKIREALAYSIDKSQLMTKTLNASGEATEREGEVINGPILPGFLGYNQDIKKYNYNPAEANKILDDKGWKRIETAEYNRLLEEKKKAEEAKAQTEAAKKTETAAATTTETVPAEVNDQPAEPVGEPEPEPAFYRQKDGRFLTIKLTAVNQPESSTAAKIIRDFWQAVGIKVELELVDSYRIQRDVIKSRSYEAFLYSEILGSDPDPYAFWHSSQNQAPGVNLAVFSDRNVDKLLEDARQTNDLAKREEYYFKFQNILADQLPAIFLYSPTYTYAVDKKIKGIDTERITLPSDRFANIANWYIKTSTSFKAGN
ncbi:MAG: peptide ABC transporter substrate-binding protein [bacterium]